MDADDGLQQTWNGRSRVWVAYVCTTEEVQQHFESYRTVNRVIMLTDKCGQPKGFAYVEFPEAEAVQEALALNESELHGRPLKVLPKRTNVSRYKQFRPGLTICIWVLLQGALCTLLLLFALWIWERSKVQKAGRIHALLLEGFSLCPPSLLLENFTSG